MKFKKVMSVFILTLLMTSCGVTSPQEPDNKMPFTEPLKNAFNYCPSIMQTDANTRYIFYCANNVSGVVQDHIIVRKGTYKGKTWTFTEKKVALAPTEGAYDGLHVCDPTVIRGEFTYNGQQYKYLMAYTGNTSNINNKVGLAVSNDLEQGWVKVSSPIVTYSGDPSHWGVGQPSLVSVDKKGKVMLFYAIGSTYTGTIAERWDFSDLNNPIREYSTIVSGRGLTDLKGNSNDFLNNADFAYDPVRRRFWAVSDAHPNPTDADPVFVASHFRITYISETDGVGDLFSSIESMAGRSWSTHSVIGPEETGFPRNSNCGLVTDEYGWMLPGDTMELYYSMSYTGNNYYWTYRIYPYSIKIVE